MSVEKTPRVIGQQRFPITRNKNIKLFNFKCSALVSTSEHNATLLKRITKTPVNFVLVSNGPTQRLHSVGMVFFRRGSSLYSLKIKGEWASVDFKPTKINPSGSVNFGKRNISSWTAWSSKMRSVGFPETTVTNYHSRLRKISEERLSNLHRVGSLKSRQEFPSILNVNEARFFYKRVPRSTSSIVHFPWSYLIHTSLFQIAQLVFNGPTCFHCKPQPSAGSYTCWRQVEHATKVVKYKR